MTLPITKVVLCAFLFDFMYLPTYLYSVVQSALPTSIYTACGNVVMKI